MYPTDLTDTQWQWIKPFTERSDARGALSKYSKREIINAILYINKTGCQWRMLPSNFPPWQCVYDHFRRWQQREVWTEICRELNKRARQKGGATPHRATF